ncbi:hypothetical protein Goari_010075 [Gossypium aridum]|uniref:Uncharacterized protein n=1 Tax=Gossypium aridum TaxID=34290 RepID=A0A7J8XYV7_GOSAI|nr:hypothetical protein [Gossypium aridum]
MFIDASWVLLIGEHRDCLTGVVNVRYKSVFACLSFSMYIENLRKLLLLIPVEILRWIIILIAGSASSCFVALNLKSYIEGANDLKMMVVAAFLLQMALAIFIKVWFFP